MNNRWNTILFDLDGTLTDPGEGITASVQYALSHFGLGEQSREQLDRFIGPPLVDSFVEYYGFSPAQAAEAAAKYREAYQDGGIFQNVPYPGIHETLEALVAEGKTLMVATSKPWVFARRILEHFDLSGYFTFVGGSELDGTRTRKAEVIAHVLAENGLTDLGEVIMVGDRRHDVEGAHACGLGCVGVAYGYGGEEELRRAGAVAVAKSLSELLEILC